MRLVSCLFALVLALIASTASAQPSAIDLDQDWQYRWGDSPFDDAGNPLWVRDGAGEAWQAIGFPSNPPERHGQTNAWFRTVLPDGEWNDPVLYIYSVDLIAEVYLQGKRIYHYGTFDDQGQGRFEGWPWHRIALPPDFAGQPIYFRIYSNYSDIGLWGEVKVLEDSALTLYILRESRDALVVSGVSLLIALLALAFALVQTGRRSFASIALFSFASGAMLLAESQASQLLWNAPLFWDYVAAGSYYLLPVAIGLLLAQWLSDTRPVLINVIWKGHLVYVVAALGLALSGAVNLSSTFPVFDILFVLSSALLFTVVARRFRSVSFDQRLIIACYALFTGFLLVDMAVAHGFLPWGRVPVSWGALAFAAAIVVISIREYSRTQQALKVLNRSLEQKVSERTARLEDLAHREQRRAEQLDLENENSRYLNDLIARMQDCGSLKQSFSILATGLPQLCRPFRGRFYGRLQADGAFELLQCWGYGQHGELLETLPENLDHLPPVSRIDGQPGGDDAETIQSHGARAPMPGEPWCLHITLRGPESGSFVCGGLLLEPDGSEAEAGVYSRARLLLTLDHAAQKIAITLSTIALREELEKYSYEDALTHLKNRRFFDEMLRHEIAMAKRHELPLSLLLIDIDYFKRFNDRYGHEAGDAALQTVARVLVSETRDSDVVCRLGGEEFVIIMPSAGEGPALDRAELLRRAVAGQSVVYAGQALTGLTVSIGVATWPGSVESEDALLRVADQGLYRAKSNGRNCVSAA